MRIVKCIALMLAAFILIGTTCAAAKNPVRVARLPILYHGTKPSHEICNTLELKIARAVKIPLNGTLQAADFLNINDSKETFKKIWRNLRNETNSPKIIDAVKILSNELNADVVICPIIQRYSQHTMPSSRMNSDTHLSSSVTAELIIYDRRVDEIVDKRTTRNFNDSYHKLGTAAHLAGECLDTLIKETQLRQLIRAIK